MVVSTLDSKLNGPGLSPGRGSGLCPWARHFTGTLTVPLSTQVYKWVLANLLLGVNPAMDQHPIQGGGGGGGGWTTWLGHILYLFYKIVTNSFYYWYFSPALFPFKCF